MKSIVYCWRCWNSVICPVRCRLALGHALAVSNRLPTEVALWAVKPLVLAQRLFLILVWYKSNGMPELDFSLTSPRELHCRHTAKHGKSINSFGGRMVQFQDIRLGIVPFFHQKIYGLTVFCPVTAECMVFTQAGGVGVGGSHLKFS